MLRWYSIGFALKPEPAVADSSTLFVDFWNLTIRTKKGVNNLKKAETVRS